ncbi:MAG TPA: GatB/YqeY domain-containing protein [Alphaproteobacteria bacterium]|nr:glutamyl-tRNA amidotransferase [Rhodospirillaceae bacterium]HRJ12148.1 GatB/YqeY domain-containing protein [Alphaproteobacteria bacterium]
MLREKINDDIKTAMKSGDSARTSVLRMINAAIKQKDIDARSEANRDVIADAAILSLLQSMIKQRRESIALYEQGNRPELAAKEQAEINVIESYLPAQVSEAEARKIISDIISSTGASGVRDMGKVMGAVKEKLSGQFDTAEASKLVKELLVG